MGGTERVKKLLENSGLPEDAVFSSARVTMVGRSGVTVEGQRGVIELSAERIRFRTGSGMLAVAGSALLLRELSPDTAVITGDAIDAVSFL